MAKSLEAIAKVESEENKREIAEMKQEIKDKEKEKRKPLKMQMKLLQYLKKENIELSEK